MRPNPYRLHEGLAAELMKILVVDDNQPVRHGVIEILAARPDWEICGEAKDGAEALQKARELVPHLVLLDISMPGLNGLEVARLLRNEVPDVNILIMSQHDPAQLLPRAIEAGAQGCVDKSRLALDLIPGIETVFRKSAADARIR